MGFSGANSRKNRPILRDFRGKKVKIRGKIGRFRGIFAEEKSKFAKKSADFADFSGKIQISRDFQGQIIRKIGRFHGKSRGGNFAKKQSVKKQLISLDFFWQISLKSINFASI